MYLTKCLNTDNQAGEENTDVLKKIAVYWKHTT